MIANKNLFKGLLNPLLIGSLIVFLSLGASCIMEGQTIEFEIERNEIDNSDSDYGYYLAIRPKSNEIKGAMVLLPGFGQDAEDVFKESSLHRFAYENNILTIAFTTKYRMLADSVMQSKLNAMLNHVKTNYKVEKDKFVFGGFSAGGRIILRYAELCAEFPHKYPVIPEAVFLADAPIDVFHSWNIMQELKSKAQSKIAVEEALWVEKMYKRYYNTTPIESPITFESLNPFLYNSTTIGNEKFLKGMAVRAYHDVDIPWRLYNRNQTVDKSNYLVTSELINRLRIMGNERAEFIQSKKIGYRANGNRHPHSWSIIDEKECINWILKNIDHSSISTVPSSKQEKAVIPFSIDKASISGMNMKRGRNPAQPNRKLFFLNIFSGEELRVQVVSSENAIASHENHEIDELLFLNNGGAILSPKNSSIKNTYLKDDFFLVPAGFSGEWETIGAPDFHHEISITSIIRNESQIDENKTKPVLLDKNKISGIGITEIKPGKYYDLLYLGHELTVTLEGEVPQSKAIVTPMKEQVIFLVNGVLTLTDIHGVEQEFSSGEWLVIPNGFTGTWRTNGLELCRMIIITKSNWE